MTHDLLEEEALRAFRQKVVVRGLTDEAIAATQQWQGRLHPFDWESIRSVLRKSHPDRLELSLWHSGQLCGMASGRVSPSKVWVSLTYIEGSPDPSHALKKRVVPLALVGADIYASLIQHASNLPDKPSVRILRPLPQSMQWYRQQGYSEVYQANGYSFLANFKGAVL